MRVAHPPAKPLLIFDGACRFCRHWVARWQRRAADRVEFRPFQDETLAPQYPELPRSLFEQSVVLIEPGGDVFTGAEAIFHALGQRGWLWAYQHVPGVRLGTETGYRFVANHRPLFSWFTRLLWGAAIEPPTYRHTVELFLRALGVIYLIAFVSLWTQIHGLVGSHGILPAEGLVTAWRTQSYAHNWLAAFWLAPSLCWFGASDAMLHALCGAGTLLAVLVIAGRAVAPALALLWLLYLSLLAVCGVFLGYQWDVLLLETGFLAVFLALGRTNPSRLVIWLLRWLLFRLMFSSGIVKLTSGDPTWWHLTALTIHYETQPLPTWIGWYAHQLPLWFQKLSCAIMFAIELGLPWLIFLPRRPRAVAAAGFTVLMVLIALTGNYCFFNLLTVALCVLLLDDSFLRTRLKTSGTGVSPVQSTVSTKRTGETPVPLVASNRYRRWLTVPLAAVILLVTVVQQVQVSGWRVHWPRPIRWAYLVVYPTLWPLHSLNTYGLFRNMTTRRPEIILEGSADGQTWHAYEFPYQAGDPQRRPRFIEPHQPRLDWQMWFEALRPAGQPSDWFLSFCVRLLQGEPAVLRLLRYNPFPESPPRYLRATVYDYRFTTPAERRATGNWWKREEQGPYCPVLQLR